MHFYRVLGELTLLFFSKPRDFVTFSTVHIFKTSWSNGTLLYAAVQQFALE
jgi:hypothetical protein